MKASYSKVIDLADFEDPDFRPFLQQVRGDIELPEESSVVFPDARHWECAMMLRAFAGQGIITPQARFAGVGAGTGSAGFLLAQAGGIVFAADRYLEVTPWTNIAPAAMMVRPDQFANHPLPRGSVIPVHADPRSLNLPDGFFDGAYALGTLEHLGSLEAAAAACEEIGRILKPGGVASIVTSFRLEGPNDSRWFDDAHILFTPALIQEYIVIPSGLELLGEILTYPSERTYDNRPTLLDFTLPADEMRSVQDKRDSIPNLVLFHKGFLFCSVHLALRKPYNTPTSALHAAQHASSFADEVDDLAAAASGVLTSQIREWDKAFNRSLLSGNDDCSQPISRDQLNIAYAETQVLQRENARLERLFLALLEPLQADPSIKARETYGYNGREADRLTTTDLLIDSLLAAQSRSTGRPETVVLQELRSANPNIVGRRSVECCRFQPEQFRTVVGSLSAGVMRSGGRDGWVIFGPYVPLAAGSYRVIVEWCLFKGEYGELRAEACDAAGGLIYASYTIGLEEVGSQLVMELRLPQAAERFELRVKAPAGADIGIGQVIVEQRVLVTTLEHGIEADPAEAPDELEALRQHSKEFSSLTITWQPVSQYEARSIRTLIGTFANGMLLSEGREGFLSHGPYATLSPGRYRAVIHLVPSQADDGIIHIDICHQAALELVADCKVEIQACWMPLMVEFDLVSTVYDLEIRIKVPSALPIGLRRIEIDRRQIDF